MGKITGPFSKLGTKVLGELALTLTQNPCRERQNMWTFFLGDYFGLHPKYEEAKRGENLSIVRGEFGVSLQGTHPDVAEATERDSKSH